jgi:pyrrolidone-carboxylate peptidase
MTTAFSTAPMRETTDGDDTPVRILVTGFLAIETGQNASEVVIRSLMNDLPSSLSAANHLFHFRLVDSNTHDLRFKLQNLLTDVCSSMCVFVGQAPGRNNITLENTATNLRFTGPPLHPGAQADHPPRCSRHRLAP